jgi:hypothetical protein
VQVRDVERNLRSYFRAIVIRVVSKARTDAARWCVGRSNKYWLITQRFPGVRSTEVDELRVSLVCQTCARCCLVCLWVCLCVFVWPSFIVANFYVCTMRRPPFASGRTRISMQPTRTTSFINGNPTGHADYPLSSLASTPSTISALRRSYLWHAGLRKQL